MNSGKKSWVGMVSLALVCGASLVRADGWERGCGVPGALPQGDYRDMRRFEPDRYAPERFVSWAADRWVDNDLATRYENKLRAYGSRYAPDPYAAYDGAYGGYRSRYPEPVAEGYRYAGRERPGLRESEPGDYNQVYPAHGDARYGDEYEYAEPDRYPGYARDRREMLNKQAAYLAGRVYTSP